MVTMKSKKNLLLIFLIGLMLAFSYIKMLRWETIKRLFTRMWTALRASPMKLQKLNLYTSCYHLPLCNYIDIVCDKKIYRYKRFRLLPVKQSILVDCIIGINDQVLAISGNKQVKNIESLAKKAKDIENKIHVLSLAQSVLIAKESDKAMKALKIMRLWPVGNREQALKTLSSALFGLGNEYKELRERIESVSKDKKKSGTGRDTMIKIIQQLNDEVSAGLNKKSSLAEYLVAVSRLNEKIESQKKK